MPCWLTAAIGATGYSRCDDDRACDAHDEPLVFIVNTADILQGFPDHIAGFEVIRFGGIAGGRCGFCGFGGSRIGLGLLP